MPGEEKDKAYKLDGVDEYGRPKYKISNFDSYMRNPATGITKGFYAPLDFPFSIWGERKIENAPPTENEMKFINKRKGDLKANVARLKAEKKSNRKMNLKDAPKPSAPKPSAPKPSAPKPSAPPTKKTMPGKPDYKKKYYSGA